MTENNIFLGNTTVRKSQDRVEVILRDQFYNPIYKGKAEVGNKTEMRKLIDDLKLKGVEFKEAWI